ncbi:hypothetical protein LEP1GSC047_2414 [Leptospira inadai serovar Lyme str. 10]|uniref:Uncharacterized protein n=2 Tax=Leptospira inadai serovar Lyme TaxID=293084 RepID=V6HPC0_9LEPT|nr:hypothetical protein LEP1GSC047_2414 [Leptospira inadai serovar Lyme str. 10]PNV75242.1 hypothetical protein BES34_010195 [Leptospira inadai serovar Lyme]
MESANLNSEFAWKIDRFYVTFDQIRGGREESCGFFKERLKKLFSWLILELRLPIFIHRDGKENFIWTPKF